MLRSLSALLVLLLTPACNCGAIIDLTDAGPGNTLFYVATNAAELASGLRAFAKTVCCDCIN